MRFLQRDQFQRAIGKDTAARQQAFGQLTQRGIFYQLQAKQGGKYAERTDLQRVFVYGAKGGRVHGNARHRQIIVTDRRHAHHPEQTAQGGQFASSADPYRAVALHREAFDLAGDLQLMSQCGIFAQNLSVGFRHQLQQIAVQRYLLLVHVRHRVRESGADFIR